MGLFSLDSLDDPKKLAMLEMGLSMLAPKPYKTGVLGDIGSAGLQGLQTLTVAKQQERQNRTSDLQTLLGIQSSIYGTELPKMLQQGNNYSPPPTLQAINQRINDLAMGQNLSGGTKKALSDYTAQATAPAGPPAPAGAPAPASAPMGAPAPGGAPMGAPSGAPAAQGAVPTSVYGVPMSAFAAASMAKNAGVTDFLKALVDARKPVNGRPGGTIADYDENGNQRYRYLPKLETGMDASFGPDGKSSVGVAPGFLDAASAINRTTAGATQAGKQAETYVDVPVGGGQTMRMTNAQYEAFKARQPQQPQQPQIPPEVLAAAAKGQPFNATQAPGGPVQFGAPPTAQVSVTEPSKLINNAGMGGLGVSPSPVALAGAVTNVEKGATNRQKVMSDDYANLSQANSNAQTVISRLQTIKQLGPQALTGAQVEKRDFFNGLLSLVGVKGAEDAKTAGDLVDKNAAQIALAIGAGSNGTDALRSLAQVANPSRHMTVEAMNKAVDSLVAPMQMSLVKGQMLTPHFSQGDTGSYFAKKQAFDQAADPRVFELQSLPPQAQQAYVQSLSPTDAKALLAKRQALKQIGVLQ